MNRSRWPLLIGFCVALLGILPRLAPAAAPERPDRTDRTVSPANDCDLPCGPVAVLSCAATGNTSATDNAAAETFFNTMLYSTNTMDGFCNKDAPDADSSTLQNYYFNTFCSNQKGSFYSYGNFTGAVTEVSNAIAAKGGTFDFACRGTRELRNKELMNFFATISQETTNAQPSDPDKYQTDGLYARYENGALLWCWDSFEMQNGAWAAVAPKYSCSDFGDDGNYKNLTQYYPRPDYYVQQDQGHQTYTKQFWSSASLDGQGNLSGNQMDLTQSPNVSSWAEGRAPQTGYVYAQMNDAIKPGYWVGSGPIQLTGDSMMGFFGWYYNTVSSPAQDAADLQQFVRDMLTDGQRAYEGALWYWLYRIAGTNLPAIHDVLYSSPQVCHDIAIATRLVNGGCNDYPDANEVPMGRLAYYQYYATKFAQSITPSLQMPYDDKSGISWTLDSLQCQYKTTDGQSANPNPLQECCLNSVLPSQ